MNPSHHHLVIMAGGIGSRFWPMSSPETPKQFLDILGCGKTLLQLTVERFEGIIPIENIWVVTGSRYKDYVKEQLPDIPQENILLEPCQRSTAPCICYAAWRIKKRDSRATMVVAPSDHSIVDVKGFRDAIEECIHFASETDAIITLGIKPTRPETGYGYIKGDLSYASSRHKNIFRVDSFKEKPTLEVAEEYYKQSCYLWNAGIFVWSVNTIVNAFRVYASEISKIFESMLPIYATEAEQATIDEKFPECPNISVDYAILEKSEEIFVYPGNFGWSDLGTWGSLREQCAFDNYGNACIGNNIKMIESHNNIVHTAQLEQVVIQGLEGCIVAEKDGKLLICKLTEEQRIKLFH